MLGGEDKLKSVRNTFQESVGFLGDVSRVIVQNNLYTRSPRPKSTLSRPVTAPGSAFELSIAGLGPPINQSSKPNEMMLSYAKGCSRYSSLMIIRMMSNTRNTTGATVLSIGSLTLICARNASSIVIPSQNPAHATAPANQ